ncbi:hypothetical protein IZY60_01890 [Lutibacter sp. B2]|nr:hypothetical protein [Lutibacter sp. B2]
MEKNQIESTKKGFIVPLWDKITKILSYISILNCIIYFWRKKYNMDKELKTYEEEKVKKHQSLRMYKFIELWVFCHTFLAIGTSVAVYYIFSQNNKILLCTLMIYALIRIFEIVVYQLRVIIFDGIGKKDLLKGARRSILLLVHNIIEIVFWYATITMILISLNFGGIKLHELGNWNDYIKSSALFITTYGDTYTSVAKITNSKFLVELVFWEVLCGFIMVIVSLTRFLSLLPTPAFIDEKDREFNQNKRSKFTELECINEVAVTIDNNNEEDK